MCFDWLFNMQIPASTKQRVIIRPSAKTFITGLASAYDEEFDYDNLSPYMSRLEFTQMMERMND